MSDPMTNVEIQDVLSSIRRLVSEEKRVSRGESRAALPRVDEVRRGKLVLTDALRVDSADDPAVAAEAHAIAESPLGASQALGADVESLEDTIAELEAAVASIGGEFEPDGSEIAAAEDQDMALDEAFEGGFHVDDGLGGKRQVPVEGPAAVSEEAAPDAGEDQPVDRAETAPTAEDEQDHSEIEPDPTAMDVSQGTNEPEPAEGPQSGDTEPVGTGDGQEAAEAALASGRPEERKSRLHLSPAERVDDPPQAVWDRDDAFSDSPDTDSTGDEGALAALSSDADDGAPGLFEASDDSMADIDLLRDLVAEVLRQELQGPLGERITRNVRKLVRREINRALESSGVGKISPD